MTTVRFEVGKGKTDLVTFDLDLDVSGAVALADDRDGASSGEPDFTMIMKPDEFDAVVAGDRTLDVGYMQGTVKVTGNVGRLLSVLPLLTDPEFVARLGAVATD